MVGCVVLMTIVLALALKGLSASLRLYDDAIDYKNVD